MFLNANYKNLISYFEENKEKDWKEWLEFDKILKKPVLSVTNKNIISPLKKSSDKRLLLKSSELNCVNMCIGVYMKTTFYCMKRIN